MVKENFLKISKKSIQVLMLFQILIGIVFIIRNINYMPKYGDTAEFLEISQTMKLDIYRPFIYPYILNIANKITNMLNFSSVTYVTYFIQSVVNLFSCFILVSTIKETFNIRISKKEIILYTLFVFFIPLNIHFNMSIKSDSLATSFTILFICYLIKCIKTKKNKFAIYTLIAMFITANIRSERIYFLSFTLIATIIMEIITSLYNKTIKLNVKKILILVSVLILGILTTNIAKSIFQSEENATRSQSTLSMYIYERTVGNILPDIYEYLPDNIKQTISYEEALASASDKNKYKIPYEKLLKEDGNLNRVNEIIKIAVTKKFPIIIINIISDFIKNMTSPYYLIMNPNDEMYSYTLSRMEGEHPLFTDCYILCFNIIFIIANIFVIINKLQKLITYKDLMIIIFYALTSSGFFACLTGFNFHIRYIIPVYVVQIAIVTILLNTNRENQEMKIYERKSNY